MLTLDISHYTNIANIFKEKYKPKLQHSIEEKQSELGELYTLLRDSHLDKLLLYTPNQQFKLIRILLSKYPYLKNKKSKEIKALKYIFIENGYKGIDKKEFYDNLGINSCIYCNRNYIFNLYANGHIKGQLDHFYDKATYPFLAMSFYNLIPSCESCNRVKGTYNTYTNKSINPYMRKEKKLFNIQFTAIDNMKYKLQNDDLLEKLLIEETYNQGHTDMVNDMYEKFYQEETKEHFKMLKKEFENLHIQEEDIHRYLTCGYYHKENFHKRTFSKLIKDISQELKLIQH